MIRKIGICLVAAALAGGPAMAADYSVNAASPPAARHMRHPHLRNSGLTPELRMMWHREEKPRLRAMTREQRHGWLKREWASMSDVQKRSKLAELQAKWAALPANVRQAMTERKQHKRQMRRMRRAERARGGNNAAPATQH